MDSLPESLLLEILSHLSDSTDVARSRVALKAFNTVFPFLRSINLPCSIKWYENNNNNNNNNITSENVQSYKLVFLDLVSTLKTVETVRIGHPQPMLAFLYCMDPGHEDFYLEDDEFVNKWMPKVSETLKSLSMYGSGFDRDRVSNILPLISKYCHNLVDLYLKYAFMSLENLKPMPMLTRLTLEYTTLNDEDLNKINTCLPNLQVLNLLDPSKVIDPVICLVNLKACHLDVADAFLSTLTLIAPNLITLKVKCSILDAMHIEAPRLSHFHLFIQSLRDTLIVKKFENLKTLVLDSYDLGSVLLKFPVTKTVENLTLMESEKFSKDSKLSLAKVFMVFPNVSSLCVESNAWSELEGQEILDRGNVLKTICAYLTLVDQSLTFSYVASLLDQCVGLSEVSFLIHCDANGCVSERFMSKCMARWPGLMWRWGIFSYYDEYSWITK
ncbi:F-box/LRR-repeat protein At4g29420-like [Bidens hawaiensis]|uniref:F-box/LRR-repeat protein At4g29420-like n=1 Tax=Bidens hawaiensis TaxID=980011 RepID=UPI00404985ED